MDIDLFYFAAVTSIAYSYVDIQYAKMDDLGEPPDHDAMISLWRQQCMVYRGREAGRKHACPQSRHCLEVRTQNKSLSTCNTYVKWQAQYTPVFSKNC